MAACGCSRVHSRLGCCRWRPIPKGDCRCSNPRTLSGPGSSRWCRGGAFWRSRESTNGGVRGCVRAGACTLPKTAPASLCPCSALALSPCSQRAGTTHISDTTHRVDVDGDGRHRVSDLDSFPSQAGAEGAEAEEESMSHKRERFDAWVHDTRKELATKIEGWAKEVVMSAECWRGARVSRVSWKRAGW